MLIFNLGVDILCFMERLRVSSYALRLAWIEGFMTPMFPAIVNELLFEYPLEWSESRVCPCLSS
jgi:hypothetical protein